MKLKTTLPFLIGSAYEATATGAAESNAINAWVMQNFKAFLDCTNAIDMGVDDEKTAEMNLQEK
jgi:hypothetical protein